MMSIYYPEYEEEHLKLLAELIEAERSVPRSKREYFHVSKTFGGPGVKLIHPGWTTDKPRVFMGDIEVLANAGLLALSYDSRGDEKFYMTPKGYGLYLQYRQNTGAPLQRVESTIRDYLNHERFRSRYPVAYEKWCQAEQLLWGGDEAKVMTMVGHLTRETMQEFASALVEHFKPANVENDKAKTVSRLKSVIESQSAWIGNTEQQLVKALVSYWGAVSDLVQRQEHGAAKESSELIWPDARRTVLQTALVMFEMDCLLRPAT